MTHFLFTLLLLVPLAAQNSLPSAALGSTGAVLKIVAVEDGFESENRFVRPDAGMKFVAIQLLFDNKKGKAKLSVNPFFCKLKDHEGNSYSVYIMGKDPSLGSESVDPGDIARGWVTFAIPSHLTLPQLRFRYESFAGKSGWLKFS